MTRDELSPGDCLMYAPQGIWSVLIAVKTWNWVSHCEAYVGDGYSVASRDGIGIGRYPLRTKGLVKVLTPNGPFELAAAAKWFETVRGQKYDWIGLLRFLVWCRIGTDRNDKMFCSEFLTRWYRAGGMDPFNKNDADSVAPATFLYSRCFEAYDFEPER